MIRSSVRSAGLAILLMMNGCGSLAPSGSATGSPGLGVAEAALEAGAGQIALQVSEGVLRRSPNNTQAMAISADALVLLGDYDQATPIYQTLLAKDPGFDRAITGLGRIRLNKDPAAAEALFQQVLRRAPTDMTAINNIGIARDLQGRHAEAQAAYRQALAINPELDSAQVNLALSMAMTGQGAAAAKLLRTKASQPGAPVKMKHDFAVVLALAGNRAEAERVLSSDLSPEETREVLDNVTGKKTRPAPSLGDEQLAGRFRDDAVPPDVVQAAAPVAQPAQIAAARPVEPQLRPIVAAQLTPPPMIVRPHATTEPESDAPISQPVSPIAAAVANQRALALPMYSGPGQGAAGMAPAPVSSAPDVVAMPPALPQRRWAALQDSPDGYGHALMTDTPASAPPVQRAASPPPSRFPAEPAPVQAAAAAANRVAPVDGAMAEARRGSAVLMTVALDKQAAPTPVATNVYRAATAAPAIATPATTAIVSADPAIVPLHARPAAVSLQPATVALSTARTVTATPPSMPATTGTPRDASPMVQFTATTSEKAAHSFWQDLVRRFPGLLAQREPVVIRFERDGRAFWRVRAEGFASSTEAETLCTRIRAGGQDCFVPRT